MALDVVLLLGPKRGSARAAAPWSRVSGHSDPGSVYNPTEGSAVGCYGVPVPAFVPGFG